MIFSCWKLLGFEGLAVVMKSLGSQSSWPYLGREVSGWKYQTSGLPLVVGAVIIVDNVRGKVSTGVVRAIIVAWTESRVLFVLTYLMNWE